jgi:hypothetical protein
MQSSAINRSSVDFGNGISDPADLASEVNEVERCGVVAPNVYLYRGKPGGRLEIPPTLRRR